MRTRLVLLLTLTAVAACGDVSSEQQDAAPVDAAVDAAPDAPLAPAISCLEAKTRDPSATTGVFVIDPDADGPNAPFEVFCDMEMDEGGWILAMSVAIAPNGFTWTRMEPSFTPPTSPLTSSIEVLDHSTIALANVQQMMLMGGDRILRFYYPRAGVDFTTNFRDLTERTAFRPENVPNDAPHTGSDRDGCGHLNDACATTDFAAFKAADPSCPRDPTNSHGVAGCIGNCGTFGHCPGQGEQPPTPTPNCWFFGGTNATAMPSISACPAESQAPWASYATGTLTGFYTL